MPQENEGNYGLFKLCQVSDPTSDKIVIEKDLVQEDISERGAASYRVETNTTNKLLKREARHYLTKFLIQEGEQRQVEVPMLSGPLDPIPDINDIPLEEEKKEMNLELIDAGSDNS